MSCSGFGAITVLRRGLQDKRKIDSFQLLFLTKANVAESLKFTTVMVFVGRWLLSNVHIIGWTSSAVAITENILKSHEYLEKWLTSGVLWAIQRRKLSRHFNNLIKPINLQGKSRADTTRKSSRIFGNFFIHKMAFARSKQSNAFAPYRISSFFYFEFLQFFASHFSPKMSLVLINLI